MILHSTVHQIYQNTSTKPLKLFAQTKGLGFENSNSRIRMPRWVLIASTPFPVEQAHSTCTSFANPQHQILSPNLMTCTSFRNYACCFIISIGLHRIAFQELVMKERCSGTIHPTYTHNERKWYWYQFLIRTMRPLAWLSIGRTKLVHCR